MAYRNKVYVSFDADSDMNYYRLLEAWNANENFEFTFYNAHNVNNIYDKSEDSIKAGLQERFRNTKVFVILVGEHTRYLYKYVRWEAEQAIKRDIPIIVVNLNGKRNIDRELCPPVLREALAIHIPFKEKILTHALNTWPDDDYKYRKAGETGPYRYKQSLYQELGL